VEAKYAGGSVPRPPHWSGFRLVPARIEFWTGKESRLHERELFTRTDKDWQLGLLNP
jgi:pyridoxamine 5'-phosphate oxidase